MPDTNAPKYIDAAGLETRFCNNRAAFPRWISKRGFPAPRYLGNRRLWVLTEVEAWEAAQFRTGPAATAKNLTPYVAAPTLPLQTR